MVKRVKLSEKVNH